MEVKEKDGQLLYYSDHFQVYPDFLSGTATKILSYDRQVYYKPVFKHFIRNLKNSKYLIVIGYSFGDIKINEFIEKYFLKNPMNKLIVIDISKPKAEILNYNNVKIFEKSISDINHADIITFIDPNF